MRGKATPTPAQMANRTPRMRSHLIDRRIIDWPWLAARPCRCENGSERPQSYLTSGAPFCQGVLRFAALRWRVAAKRRDVVRPDVARAGTACRLRGAVRSIGPLPRRRRE